MASGQIKMLQLYRNLIREAKNWNAYNYREYALRKIRHEFRLNRSIEDEEAIANFYKKGIESLEMIKRQSTIGSLYSARPLIIENQNINKSSVKKSL
ncbi:hypothetical protein HCN44_000274 [Aphidius gifuensis]|uniref:Complex 1 LYR protein domain-containing protein n=1 Tax=Aphidius gifuensis TaxID=684658 RepID=A0A835CPC3_APHGI|nr:LYR motif-containing protein 4 [Aphidius gifuensis]KAF7990469.1 hypothetical protein HCN44_000274 [Aphidius gifuensis]